MVFQDEEEESPTHLSLKVRIPKAGAYIAETGSVDKKPKFDLELDSKTKQGLGTTDENLHSKVEVKEENSKKMKKGVKKKDSEKISTEEVGIKKEEIKSNESPLSSPVKEIPQCLKFKLSNGKMVR